MILTDIFTFKQKFQEVFNSDAFKGISLFIKGKIVEKIKNKIPGEDKMNIVIAEAIDYVNKKVHSDNKLVQWVIDVFVIANLRHTAQTIYDQLKEVVEGL